MISVVIADDQPLVRSGLRMILEGEADISVVAEAADGDEAVALVLAHQPDVLLLDVQMPGIDGIAAMKKIAAHNARVLILTTFDLDEYVHHTMRAGASGFLLKDMSGEDIVSAVRQVARGADSLLAPSVTRRLIQRFAAAPPQPSTARLGQLTAREVDVLRLVGRGMSNAEIARELFIAESTVKTHVVRVLMKLGLRDRVHAAIAAHQAGLT
ncbi:response regulator [Dactylosporangium sp. NPDC048998]|uniref:response regulator n=1 Tax=Dactylosporangium sp. NPDC048998 TaxID=3363976 RepID=UPI003715A55F